MSVVDAHLEITPDNSIEFILLQNEATPKVTMTLRHPDADSAPVAFKVKTTQPRRYLVRPNQGSIQPGGSEQVQILLVEKDKVQLMASYNSLGAAALEHCKDKFLVQSVTVTPEQAANLQEYDQLTALWSAVRPGDAVAVANKKLHVRHRVGGGAGGANTKAIATASSPGGGGAGVSTSNLQELTQEQLVVEAGSLRRKYDELVAFSVNLTAERDMLSNTLEQTKRDLNREIAKTGGSGMARTSAVPVSPAIKSNTTNSSGGSSSTSSILSVTTALLCLMFLLVGAKLQQAGLLSSVLPTVMSGDGTGSGGGDEL